MIWNSTSSKWSPEVNNLDNLLNVDTTGKITGDQLQWNSASSKWEKFTPSTLINSAYYIVGHCTNVVNTFPLSTGGNPLHYTSITN